MENELTYVDNNINVLHSKINTGLKTTVKWAAEIGRRLEKAKEKVGHGSFVKWINDNCNFSEKTAYNYISLNRHKSKIVNVSNLQDAYKLIDFEEKKEKEHKQQEQSKKIQYREKYNEKPDNWERSDDYAWQKKKKDDQERTDRIEKTKADIRQQSEKRKEHQKNNDEWIDRILDQEKEKAGKIKKMRLSAEGKDIISVIESHLSGIPDNSRKIETCQNIIKYCRNLSAELQRLYRTE